MLVYQRVIFKKFILVPLHSFNHRVTVEKFHPLPGWDGFVSLEVLFELSPSSSNQNPCALVGMKLLSSFVWIIYHLESPRKVGDFLLIFFFGFFGRSAIFTWTFRWSRWWQLFWRFAFLGLWRIPTEGSEAGRNLSYWLNDQLPQKECNESIILIVKKPEFCWQL